MLTMTRPIDPKKPTKNPLFTVELFKRIPAAAIVEIEKCMIERRFGKRETIFLEDDPADFIWFVKQGHIKEVHHSADGRSNTLCMVGPNGMFGVSAFEGGIYGFHGVAEDEATVFSIPIQSFQALMGKCPEMARAVVSHISKLLRRSKDMQTFAQESAQKRLLHVLVEMVGNFGSAIPLTRKQIAEMAGTAVETCIRIFGRLEDEGLIASAHGKLLVKNVDDLKERIEEL